MNSDLDQLAKQIEASLLDSRYSYWTGIEQAAEELRERAAALPDELAANTAWFLATVIKARGGMARCFDQMRTGEYLDAWCGLEQIEICAQWLRRNPFLGLDRFHIPTLLAQVAEWQKLFPYRVFCSPEIIIEQAECSVCGKGVDPWNMCNHKRGNVYRGTLCSRVITKCTFISMSIVLDPVQKYSVLIARDSEGKDPSDYSMVKFVLDRIENPLDRWSGRWTQTYHPHSLFADRDRLSGCPCESGRSYRECCLPRPGVIRPHYHLEFEKHPPAKLPSFSYVGFSNLSEGTQQPQQLV